MRNILMVLVLVLYSFFRNFTGYIKAYQPWMIDIAETSGLVFFDNRLITHNDSGGMNALYEINTGTGNISRTVTIQNATNVDWEDICTDNDYIYIGDFGNNNGNRTNLKIYKVIEN